MAAPITLADQLQADGPLYTAWVGIPDPLVAEMCARAGFDNVTLDMQHGFQDYASVMRGIAAVKLAQKPVIVRVPVGDFSMASRALDAGADAVIAPMINSAQDAHDFAESMKFPPVGGRSWGPPRAMMLNGYTDLNTYLAEANNTTLAIAMVETPQAIAVADDILSTPGIDGIFMGPSDLSVTLSQGSQYAPRGEETNETIQMLAAKAHDAGKFAASFALSPDHAKDLAGFGIDLMALGTDSGYIKLGAETLLSQVR